MADSKRSKSTPTLEDVAQAASVSTATVSLCLNEPGKVVAQTRERVLAAVKALDYTPNFAARVMAAKRSFTIGAIIPTIENTIFAKGLQAFQEALHERGYTLLVASSAYNADLEEEQIRTLIARGADGLLLIGHERDPSVYSYLERNPVPTLVAWSYLPDAGLPSVGFDNKAAMFDIATEAIRLGHRSLAMISAFSAGNDRALLRIEGARAAMGAHGLDPKDLRLVETTYAIESGASAMAQILSDGPCPSVVLCGNDVIAVGALREAQMRGLRVPQDIAITGFDDMEIARIVAPALTTVSVPHREMGERAAETLVLMVEKRAEPRSIRLETAVIHRASLGPHEGR